jgi:hypothetical protein
MTYENDPNRRNRMRADNTSYTGWIIGLFTMFGRDHTNTASNDASRPTVTAPATTGSGPANTPANVPTPPAKPAVPANR